MSLPATLTAAEKSLALVESPADAKDLYDKLEMLSQYATRFRAEHEKQNEIARLKLATARKGGGLLASTVHAGNPQLSPDATNAQLPDGFTRSMSSRWQALARIPDDEWHRFIGGDDELTLKSAVRLSREYALTEERSRRLRAAQDKIASSESPAFDLHHGSLADWRPTEVSSIITDPPYVGDSIPLYEQLRDFAVDVLPDGGPLVVMTWQAILPDVIRALEHPRLAYRWTICWRFANVENTVDQKRRVFDCWKPILVYHAGAMVADAPMVRDEIASKAGDKDFHEWGQSVEGFERLVRSFSLPGETVCDPFLGGGTTAVAALSQSRRFIGCDIDATAVTTTEQRLAA